MALYGTSELPAPTPIKLSYGDLEVELCPNGHGITRTCWDGIELARGVSFVHRDAGWVRFPLCSFFQFLRSPICFGSH